MTFVTSSRVEHFGKKRMNMTQYIITAYSTAYFPNSHYLRTNFTCNKRWNQAECHFHKFPFEKDKLSTLHNACNWFCWAISQCFCLFTKENPQPILVSNNNILGEWSLSVCNEASWWVVQVLQFQTWAIFHIERPSKSSWEPLETNKPHWSDTPANIHWMSIKQEPQ